MHKTGKDLQAKEGTHLASKQVATTNSELKDPLVKRKCLLETQIQTVEPNNYARNTLWLKSVFQIEPPFDLFSASNPCSSLTSM